MTFQIKPGFSCSVIINVHEYENNSSSVQTFACDASIEMQIAKTMKATSLLFGVFATVYKVRQLVAAVLLFVTQVHNEKKKINSCSYMGVKTAKLAKWETEEGCCNLHVLTGY